MIDRQSILSVGRKGVLDFEAEGQRKRRMVAALVMHILLATVGSWIIGLLFLVYLIIPSGPINRHLILSQFLDGPFGPAFWGAGFLLGLLVNYHARHRFACWTWIAGLSWAVIAVWGSVPYGSAGHPNPGCSVWRVAESSLLNRESPECGSLGGTVVFGIAPAVSSIGYSLGAWLALRAKQKTGTSENYQGRL